MVFKKKKPKVPLPPEEEQTETISAEAENKQTTQESIEVKQFLTQLTKEFNQTYNGLVPPASLQGESLKINLLFAIYGELVKQRELLESFEE